MNFAVKAAITAGLMVVQVALGAMRKIEGPRLESKSPTLAEYNTPLRRFWGKSRLEGLPIPWAEDLREKKKKTKTKGGKYAEYKYFGTFMAVIADHEISAVRKIWLDGRLVFQLSAAGPVAALILSALRGAAEGAEVKVDQRNLVIYLGTESQLPDPRMEAWYEDHPDFGPGSCPAHRGVAYLLAKDLPLEKFANRIPQIDVEAVSVPTASYPYEERTATFNGAWTFGSAWGAHWTSWGQIEWWDPASRTLVGVSPAPGVFTGSVASVSLGDNGSAYFMSAGDLWVVAPMSAPTAVSTNAESLFYHTTTVLNGVPYTTYADHAGYVYGTLHVGHSMRARHFCVDANGVVWGVYQPDGSSDSFTVDSSEGASWTFTGLTTRSDISPARICVNAQGNLFVDGGDGYFYIIDPADGTILDSGAATWGQPADLPAQRPGQESFWDYVGAFDKVSLADGSIIASEDPFDWVFANTAESGYDPVTHAIWSRQSSTLTIHIRYLDRIDSDGVLLGDIVEDVGEQCGCTISAGALDQLVPGYSVTPGPGKDMIAPLLDIHHSVLCPHDFQIVGIKRSTTSLGTIDSSDFVREDGRYTVEIAPDTEVPLELTVSFADNTKDHQQNNVIARRASDAVDSERTQDISLTTYADTPDAMQQKADRFLRWWWNSRATIKNGVTARYMGMEPGDVWTLDLDGEAWDCEIQKATFAATTPKITLEWRRTFPALTNLGSQDGSGMTGTDDDEIFFPAPTKGFVLDIPFTDDVEAEANPLLHYAAGGYGAGTWPGAAVLEGGADGEEYGEWNAVSSTDKAIWGMASSALGTANPCLWDRGNTLAVRVFGGTLSNSTEAAINADPTINQAALSITVDGEKTWEILNFTTATLTGTSGTARDYELSGFLRGRRGTEWAVGEHAIGDDFVLTASMGEDQVGLSEVGNTLYFKVQTYGRDPDLAEAIVIPFVGQSLKPYAPVIDEVTKDPTTGDITITIRTRTRVGGAWNGSAISTGETIAEYEFDVMDGADVLRTLESTDKTFLYTAAEQTSDHGSEIEAADLEGLAYQLSASVGRGFARAA